MKTTEKGDLGRVLVVADLLRRGYSVPLPLSENLKYDLVLGKCGVLSKVQCKATNSKNDVLIAKCSSTSAWATKTHGRHKYTKLGIDILAVVDLSTEIVYYLPAELLGEGLAEIRLRLTPAKNNQRRRSSLASDYISP